MRFLHVYTMKPEDDRIPTVAPRHASYWDALAPPAYEGGPFGDRSGGLITFEASSTEQAMRWVSEDPFVTEDLLDVSIVKEWVPT